MQLIRARQKLNRNRLALSAFVVGALSCPTVFHVWRDWGPVYAAFERAKGSEEQRDHDAELASRVGMTTEAYRAQEKKKCLADDGHSEVDLSQLAFLCDLPPYDGPLPSTFASYQAGLAAAWDRLINWFLAVAIGGAVAAILGYLLPTLHAFFFQLLPKVAASYVRWLYEPEAKH